MRCTGCRLENAPDSRFCTGCGTPLRGRGPAPRPQAYTPAHLARRILASRNAIEGERKQVTVLFADVKDSVELSERLDAEEWHLILDRFFRIMTDCVHRFEGTVNQYTGDGIMALFGAPLAYEDHAQRACSSALLQRQELARFVAELRRDTGIDFQVRTGLNSGEVVVGRIGDDFRMDYTAQGRVVGEADRIQALAQGGDILLSQETAALVAGYFELEELGRFRLRGVPEEVTLHRLLGPGPMRTRLEASRARGFSPFVGRVDEMASLLASLEEARAGRGCVVGVVGEVGVGKSRLCREFAARCSSGEVDVRETQGLPRYREVPLLPVLELLRTEFGIREEDPDEAIRDKIARATGDLDPGSAAAAVPLLCEFLGLPPTGSPVTPHEPADRQRVLFDLLGRLLRTRSRRRAAVYLIEDVQWLDAASERFLAHLAGSVSETRTLLVVNFRPGYRAPWMETSSYRNLPLGPLSPHDASVLLRGLLGADLAASELAERIRERTRGNPFFIEELVRSLVETGILEGPAGARRLRASPEEIRIPPTVQALVAARIDRLAETDKARLKTAAVIGPRFALAVLERVTGSDTADVSASLERLLEADLLERSGPDPGASYAFRHPLIHEVAYASQLARPRALTHGATAEALEAVQPGRIQENAALVAYHWERAGAPAKAVLWHKRAARWAVSRDPAAALRAWQRIRDLLAAAPETPESAQLRLRACTEILGIGAWRTGLTQEEAASLFSEGRRIAARCEDRRGLARLLEAYGAARGFAGDLPGMLDHVNEALRIAEEANDALLTAALRGRVLFANVHAGRLQPALELTDRTLTERPSGTDAALAALEAGPIAIKALLLGAMGRLEEGLAYLARATRLAEKLPDRLPVKPIVLLFSTMLAWFCGDAKQADVRADAFLRHAARTRSAWDELLALLCRGQADLLNRQPAVAALEQSLRIAREHRVGLEGEADILAFLAEAYLDAGDEWRSLAAASEGVRVARQRSTPWWEIRCLRAQARTLIAKDGASREPEIRASLDRALLLIGETGARMEEPFLREQLAALAVACGDRATAARERAAARNLFSEFGAPLRAAALGA